MVTRRPAKYAKVKSDVITAKTEKSVSTSADSFLHRILGFLGERYEKFVVRFIIGMALLGWLFALIKGGLVVILASVFIAVLQCYSEFVAVPSRLYDQATVEQSKFFQWYFFFAACFYATGELPSFIMATYLKKYRSMHDLTRYHMFISFSIFIIGLIIFVLSLKKRKDYKAQFTFLAWFLLFLTVITGVWRMVIINCLRGYIWFHLPFGLIIINDSFAYFVGFLFGKTPLIKLSPKKTWEGFIGGAAFTVLGSYIITYFTSQHQYFICPIKFDSDLMNFAYSCDPPYVFQHQVYQLPSFLREFLKNINIIEKTITMKPIYIHVTVFALFASLIAPFGGFFASGLKRAFKIKDFGNILPGHGGMLDRFDCQIMMIAFVNVYLRSFIGIISPEKILQYILRLERHDQVEILDRLKEILMD